MARILPEPEIVPDADGDYFSRWLDFPNDERSSQVPTHDNSASGAFRRFVSTYKSEHGDKKCPTVLQLVSYWLRAVRGAADNKAAGWQRAEDFCRRLHQENPGDKLLQLIQQVWPSYESATLPSKTGNPKKRKKM